MSSGLALTTFDHASQWRDERCELIWSTIELLSLIITNPRGLKSLSISKRRSSMPLQPWLSISVKIFHACRRSYVRGYVENASHLQFWLKIQVYNLEFDPILNSLHSHTRQTTFVFCFIRSKVQKRQIQLKKIKIPKNVFRNYTKNTPHFLDIHFLLMRLFTGILLCLKNYCNTS